jgi:hypothetical protein
MSVNLRHKIGQESFSERIDANDEKSFGNSHIENNQSIRFISCYGSVHSQVICSTYFTIGYCFLFAQKHSLHVTHYSAFRTDGNYYLGFSYWTSAEGHKPEYQLYQDLNSIGCSFIEIAIKRFFESLESWACSRI